MCDKVEYPKFPADCEPVFSLRQHVEVFYGEKWFRGTVIGTTWNSTFSIWMYHVQFFPSEGTASPHTVHTSVFYARDMRLPVIPPKFREGDIVRVKSAPSTRYLITRVHTDKSDPYYSATMLREKASFLRTQDAYELVGSPERDRVDGRQHSGGYA